MSRRYAAGLFVALSACWAGSFVAIEVGLLSLPPLLLAAYRFDVAAVVLLPYVLLFGDVRPRTLRDGKSLLASALLVIAGNAVLLVLGQMHVTGGVAAIVYSLNPILTTALVALLVAGGGGGLDLRGYVGVLLGIVGVGLVARPDPGALTTGTTLGVLLVFGAVISVVLGGVLMRRFGHDCSSLTLTAWGSLLGAAVIHATSLAIGEPVVVPSGWLAIGAVLFLGVFASAAGYTFYFMLIDRVGPFEANLIAYVVPPLATVLGWALLDEQVAPTALLGFLVIVAGFGLVKREALATELRKLRA